jgi:hypothetical protein
MTMSGVRGRDRAHVRPIPRAARNDGGMLGMTGGGASRVDRPDCHAEGTEASSSYLDRSISRTIPHSVRNDGERTRQDDGGQS